MLAKELTLNRQTIRKGKRELLAGFEGSRMKNHGAPEQDGPRSKKKSRNQGNARKNHQAAHRRIADRKTKMDAIEHEAYRKARGKRLASNRRDVVAAMEVFVAQQCETSLRNAASGP